MAHYLHILSENVQKVIFKTYLIRKKYQVNCAQTRYKFGFKRIINCDLIENEHYYFLIFQNDSKTSLAGETGRRNSGTFLQKRLPPKIPFPCQRFNQRSGAVPDNVHQLKPGDIDVVAAIGKHKIAIQNALNFAMIQ